MPLYIFPSLGNTMCIVTVIWLTVLPVSRPELSLEPFYNRCSTCCCCCCCCLPHTLVGYSYLQHDLSQLQYHIGHSIRPLPARHLSGKQAVDAARLVRKMKPGSVCKTKTLHHTERNLGGTVLLRHESSIITAQLVADHLQVIKE